VQNITQNTDLVDSWVWIGLHRRGETNFTKWINNAPLNYTEYLPGQPEPGLWEAEQCLITWYTFPIWKPAVENQNKILGLAIGVLWVAVHQNSMSAKLLCSTTRAKRVRVCKIIDYL
jgi:hypothetical protein